MPSNKATIAGRFSAADSEREPILQTARECAALTKPWLLPPDHQQRSERLPESFQSIGAWGLTNAEGRMLLSIFPPGVPFYRFKPAVDIQYDPNVPDPVKQEIAARLLLRELAIMAKLESATLGRGRYRRPAGFRSRKRMAISQVLATGDVLEQFTDDYRLKTYGREQYVTCRDSSLDVVMHITRERIDVKKLTESQRAKSKLPADVFEDDDPAKRTHDLYTLVEWQYDTRSWAIVQELNTHVINESTESVSPYFCTAFELAPGEHYGRGLIELLLGSLRSHNELTERMIDFAGIAAKMHPILDENAVLRESDLAKPTGTVLRGRVRDGQPADIAFLRIEKLADFQVVHSTNEAIRKDLGKAFLLESEVTPRGDRVTAFQVQRVAMELEGQLGGVYSSIADEQQIPLLERVIHQMERDNLLPALPDGAVEVETTTGIAALGRELDAARLTGLIQGIAALGEPALAKINIGVLVDALARLAAFYEPGLIKSNDQIAREQQQAALQQLAMQAGEKAIDTAGNVVEQSAAATQPEPTNG